MTPLDYLLALLALAVWLIGLALLASRSPSYVKQSREWSPTRSALRTLGSGRKVWR